MAYVSFSFILIIILCNQGNLAMNHSAYDHYKVFVTGRVVDNQDPVMVAKKLSQLFKIPENKTQSMLQGKPCVLKEDVSHSIAYKYHQQVTACGAEVKIVRIPHAEKAPSFTLVPEGEEQTQFEALQDKLAQGKMVECSYCGKQQALASNCKKCGKILIARVIDKPRSLVKSKTFLSILTISVILLLAVIVWLLST